MMSVRCSKRLYTLLPAGALLVFPLEPVSAQRYGLLEQNRQAAQLPAEALDTSFLSKRVTLDLDGVPLRNAVIKIAETAGIRLLYKTEVLDAIGRTVTLRANGMPLGRVFTNVFSGTSLRAVPIRSDMVSIENEQASRVAAQATGMIVGQVVDGTTKQGVPSALVLLDSVSTGVQTGNDGKFRIPKVTSGVHRIQVRRLGYEMYSSTVNVSDGATVTVNVVLKVKASKMTEVVTTAVGSQRRLEVGHGIAHLAADSILKNTSVTSVTELLATRVPNVQVIASNGLVGSGPSIRIRGQSSLVLDNNPILIVDGIRRDNSGGIRSSGLFGDVVAPSRINDIDISVIESIDILKGPSAAAQYGTDAANGVIIITTKRGKMGPPQWSVSGSHGRSEIPKRFPDHYWAYGRTPDGTSMHCKLTDVAADVCEIDSVLRDNPLNHRNTTIYGTGPSYNADVSVGGGNAATRYFLSLGTSRAVGTIRLPSVFRSQAKVFGFPESVMEPNTQTQRNTNANISMSLTPAIDVTLSGQLNSGRHMAPWGGIGLTASAAYGPVILDSANYYGYAMAEGSPLYALSGVQKEQTQSASVSSNVTWNPAPWFVANSTVGTERMGTRVVGFSPAQTSNYTSQMPNGGGTGSLYMTEMTNQRTSVSVNGTVTIPTNVVRSATAIGARLNKTRYHGISAQSSQVTEANPTLSGTASTTASEIGSGSATAGLSVTEQLAFQDRLFVSGSLSADGASGFGSDRRVTAYPRFDVSWLMLQRGTNTVRLRSAFGTAGIQPENGASFQSFQLHTAWLGNNRLSASQLRSPGNPDLRPERSKEFEGGIDINLWNSRLDVSVTGYAKSTKDALQTTSLGVTFNNMNRQENLGDVRNRGIGVTLASRILDTKQTSWSVTMNASRNTNELTRLNTGLVKPPTIFVSQSHRVGYPLFAFWSRVATFKDADGDGYLTHDDVVATDSMAYMGSALPTVDISYSNDVSLFGGMVRINTNVASSFGNVILTKERWWAGSMYGQNDPSASLYAQAKAIAQDKFGTTSLDFQKGSFIRWNDITVTTFVPTSWIPGKRRLRDLTLTVGVQNLGILWSKFTGMDPEVSDPASTGSSYQQRQVGDVRMSGDNSVPLPRVWQFKFNLNI